MSVSKKELSATRRATSPSADTPLAEIIPSGHEALERLQDAIVVEVGQGRPVELQQGYVVGPETPKAVGEAGLHPVGREVTDDPAAREKA